MAYIFLIAVSLALDAFAVSVSGGLTVRGFKLRHALLMGAYFGAFQFMMPLLGWVMGTSVAEYVSEVGPVIAFLLLAFIGGRMIWGAVKGGESEAVTELTHRRLLVLAVATSIDALAVGVSFAFMEINILLSCTVIGAVAFLMSVGGGMLGGRLGEKFQDRAEIFGGVVLILIGVKILLENLI